MNKLQVYVIVNPPRQGDRYPVKDPKHAYELIEAIAQSHLLDDRITMNVFGLEEWNEEEQEWLEWYSEDGETLDEYRENTQALALADAQEVN